MPGAQQLRILLLALTARVATCSPTSQALPLRLASMDALSRMRLQLGARAKQHNSQNNLLGMAHNTGFMP